MTPPPEGRPSELLSAARIATRVAELGREISNDFPHGDVVLVPVLKGAFVFAADLCRAIEVPVRVDFLSVRSYSGTESTGVVEITQDLRRPVDGADVVLVEDIVDTGLTVRYLLDGLAAKRPRSLRLCALLHKPVRTRVDLTIDYLGFTIEDHFVVGYGLDVDEKFRNLPYVGML